MSKGGEVINLALSWFSNEERDLVGEFLVIKQIIERFFFPWCLPPAPSTPSPPPPKNKKKKNNLHAEDHTLRDHFLSRYHYF